MSTACVRHDVIDIAARVADAYMARREARIATFRLRFDRPHWFLRGSAWFTRFDTVFTRFGDQGILVRASGL